MTPIDRTTVREELTFVVWEACRPHGDGRTDAVRSADAVLTYLGQLDPSADPALIAEHLRSDRATIAALIRERDGLREQLDLMARELSEARAR